MIELGYDEYENVIILGVEKDTGRRIVAKVSPKGYTKDQVTIVITVKVNGKTVRILGFNHDDLTIMKETNEEGNEIEVNQYGEGKKNTKAGISFEFVDSLISKTAINSSSSNTNRWGACTLRNTLNNATIHTLENEEQIKKVVKQYIKTNNDSSSVTTADDYLWLLSCSEIWNNGYRNGDYALEIAKEGERYKFYEQKLGNLGWSEANPFARKTNCWWLRSPRFNESTYEMVYVDGSPSSCYANLDYYDILSGQKANIDAYPGFAI